MKLKFVIPLVLVSMLLAGCISFSNVRRTPDTIPVKVLGQFLPHPPGMVMEEGSPELNPDADSWGQNAYAAYDINHERAAELHIFDSYQLRKSPDWEYVSKCQTNGECHVEKFVFGDGVRHTVLVSDGTTGRMYYVPVTNRTLIYLTVWRDAVADPDTVARNIFNCIDWTGLKELALKTHENE